MTYTQAYNYILSLGNIAKTEYQKSPRDLGWYIKRLQFFLNLVGNPEKEIPHFIHIAGTSGKGSTALMIYSILRAAGKKPGVLTSPHPSVILERWEVDGKIMSKKDFARLVTRLKPKIEEYIKTTPYDMLSFSELMTAMALIYFKEQKIKWVVWETACGGRFDTTNVIPKKT
jgi:dihydrofolate synthase / folylpolyglutamate synthase